MARTDGEMSLRSLAGDPEPERYVKDVLPWVHEAGCPYFDWFFGDVETAHTVLDAWMRRPSSEVFAGRLTLLTEGGKAIGGFIALGGAELESCRSADTIAAIKDAGRDGLTDLRERLQAGKELFVPVGHDDFYLSKIGVLAEFRGRRHGTALLQRYLADGEEAGFRRFRLEVWSGNGAAIGFYRDFGFEVVAESTSPSAGLTYVSMLREH